MHAVVGICWFTWKSNRKLTELCVVVKLCLVFKNEFDQPRFHSKFDSFAINENLNNRKCVLRFLALLFFFFLSMTRSTVLRQTNSGMWQSSLDTFSSQMPFLGL